MTTIQTIAGAMARPSAAARDNGLAFDATVTPSTVHVRYSRPVGTDPDYDGIFGRDIIRDAGQAWAIETSAALGVDMELTHVYAPLPPSALPTTTVTPVGDALRRSALLLPDAIFASIGDRLCIPLRGKCSTRRDEYDDEVSLTDTPLRWALDFRTFSLAPAIGTSKTASMGPFLGAVDRVIESLDRQHALFLGASVCHISVTVSRPTAHQRMAAAADRRPEEPA